MNSDLVWTREQMMAQLGCGPDTLRALTRRRQNPIPSLNLGRRVLYPKQRVEAWLNANPEPVAPLRRAT
jgi:hypothetical protein